MICWGNLSLSKIIGGGATPHRRIILFCKYVYKVRGQTIPKESPNAIRANTCVVGNNGERTSWIMFYVPRRLMKRFLGGFLISINLPGTDLECLVRNLVFNSLKLKYIPVKQCPPVLAIPMILKHLEEHV